MFARLTLGLLVAVDSHPRIRLGKPPIMSISARASVAVVVAGSVILVMSAVKENLARHDRAGQDGPYVVGDTLPPIAGIEYSASPLTLLIVLDSESRFCREAVPVYRQVASTHRPDIAIAAMTAGPLDTLRAFLTRNAIPVDVTARYSNQELRIHGVPTLILVDRHGRVSSAWFGPLGHSGQARLLKAVTESTAP